MTMHQQFSLPQQQQQSSSSSSYQSHRHNYHHLPSHNIESNCYSANEEESYTCPQCFRTYRRHGTLRRHLRQECGKGKSMVCSVCGHRTKRADHLRQHVRKKHPEVAMRSLFRRATNQGAPTATTAGTSSLHAASTNFLQQQLNESVGVVAAAAVALNLKAVAAAASASNNFTDVVNIDDDDDDAEDDDDDNDNDDNREDDVLDDDPDNNEYNEGGDNNADNYGEHTVEGNFYQQHLLHLQQQLQQNQLQTELNASNIGVVAPANTVADQNIDNGNDGFNC